MIAISFLGLTTRHSSTFARSSWCLPISLEVIAAMHGKTSLGTSLHQRASAAAGLVASVAALLLVTTISSAIWPVLLHSSLAFLLPLLLAVLVAHVGGLLVAVLAGRSCCRVAVAAT